MKEKRMKRKRKEWKKVVQKKGSLERKEGIKNGNKEGNGEGKKEGIKHIKGKKKRKR